MVEPLRAAGLLLVSDAVHAGVAAGSDELLRARARGLVRRVRRGAYVGVDHWDGLDDTARHVLVVRAALAQQRDALVSHWSAAALHGLPLVDRRDDAVHLTVPPAGGGRSRGGIRRHQAAGPIAECGVGGVRVTTPARTLVDLGREAGLLAAVVAGDVALRQGLVTRADLDRELAGSGAARGVRAARRAIALMDPRSESPGESLSRVRMAELGVASPELQHVVVDRGGFVARVDFWWEAVQVVGEFDGRSKYGLNDGTAPGERLWAEKRREDRIRATGARVVRWTWEDAWQADPLARLLRAAGVR